MLTNLFALGSTIYKIITSKQPYESLPEEEVETRYRQQRFPNVDEHPCGKVTQGCWLGKIKSADEIMRLITDESNNLI